MLPGLSLEIMLETPCHQPCLVYSEGAHARAGCTKIAALLRFLWGGGLAGHGSPGEEMVMCSLIKGEKPTGHAVELERKGERGKDTV